ncbi:MAG: ribonuclease D [Pseudomonadota bacterium]
MNVITTTDALAAASAAWAKDAFVTVDTEFMREKTYWPILCLVQVAGAEEEAIIDPLADGIDLSPLFELLKAPTVEKVFHAARQDVEIFYNLMGETPAPLVDTQIAAMACGYGESVGYETLVRTALGVQIDKGSRFTDWSRRPLTDAQLSYALSDVTHLRRVYEKLRAEIDQKGRAGWLEEEMAVLTAAETYAANPEDAWKRLKLRHIKPRQLGVLMKVAEWREREAQTRNIPRGRVVKDDGLMEIVQHPPKTTGDLSRLRGAAKGLANAKGGERLIAAVAEGLAMDRDDLPDLERPKQSRPAPPAVVEMLKVLLKTQCERHNVAPKLIASVADLERIAADQEPDVPALKGWRREVFGEAALKLKAGEIALKVKKGRVEIVGE